MTKKDMKALLVKVKEEMQIAEDKIRSLIQLERMPIFLSKVQDEFGTETKTLKETEEKLNTTIKKWEGYLEEGLAKQTLKNVRARLADEKKERTKIRKMITIIATCQEVVLEHGLMAAKKLDFWMNEEQRGSAEFWFVMKEVLYCGESLRFLHEKARWDVTAAQKNFEREALIIFSVLYHDFIEDKSTSIDQINITGKNRKALDKLYETAESRNFIL